MKVRINFKYVNSDFSKERMEWHGGVEPDNLKYHRESTFELKGVLRKGFAPSVSINVSATLRDGAQKHFLINEMSEFECELENGDVEKFFVSKNLLQNTHETYSGKTDTAHFYFYIKDSVKVGEINKVTYINGEDFPDEIVNAEIKEFKTDYHSKAKLVGYAGGFLKNI